MSRAQIVSEWETQVSRQLPRLTRPQARVLALWRLGMALAQRRGQTSVVTAVASGLGRSANTVRQRLREWTYEARAKHGATRRSLEVARRAWPACWAGAWPGGRRRPRPGPRPLPGAPPRAPPRAPPVCHPRAPRLMRCFRRGVRMLALATVLGDGAPRSTRSLCPRTVASAPESGNGDHHGPRDPVSSKNLPVKAFEGKVAGGRMGSGAARNPSPSRCRSSGRP